MFYPVNTRLAKLYVASPKGGTGRRGGRKLDIDKFMKILRQPYYAGAIWINRKPKKGKEEWPKCNKGLHKKMITLEQFAEIQEVISKRKQKFHRKHHNPEFPMAKLMHLCGLPPKSKVHWLGKHERPWRSIPTVPLPGVRKGICEESRSPPRSRISFQRRICRIRQGAVQESPKHHVAGEAEGSA
ncbi:MAG: recombinase family protein [Hymenobacter sp.]